jgi:hypothetical protein
MKFLFTILLSAATAYFVEIDAHKEECFFEIVTAGTKVSTKLLISRHNIYF